MRCVLSVHLACSRACITMERQVCFVLVWSYDQPTKLMQLASSVMLDEWKQRQRHGDDDDDALVDEL